MNNINSSLSLLTRRASAAAAVSLVIITGVYFLYLNASVGASAGSKEVSGEENLVLGRLAYATVTGTFGGPQFGIRTMNADGSGDTGLTGLAPAEDPSWSPDGRIVYIQSGANGEIFVMNADGTGQTNLSNTSASEANPSWSAAGKIVYEREGQIWTVNADGAGQAVFTAITQPSPTDPAWSADGSKLAFVSGGEIWTINADGTNQQRVTTNASTDADPAWSPDGTKIVFGKGGAGVAAVNVNGTNEVSLTAVAGDSKPAWSPDGTTIAFRRSAAPAGIYLMDVTGGNQVRIRADQQTSPSIFVTNDNPAWQPVAQTPNTFTISGRITRSGASLAGATVNLSGTTNAAATTDAAGNYQFSGLPAGGNYVVSPSMLNHYFTPPNRTFSNINGNRIADFTASGVCVGAVCAQNGRIAFVREPDIYTMNADGSDLINITNSAALDTDPNYSPDGSKIVFTTRRDGNDEIYRMNADGSAPVRLTNNSAADTKPYFSPDGASIVFVSNRDGNLEIYKMNADGTGQVRLTNDTLNQNTPAFSPDGQKIIYITQVPWKLFTMNADGSNQQAFADPNQTNYYYRPSYSPNGSKIILEYATDITGRNIYTMNANGTGLAPFPAGRSHPQYSPDGTKVVHECCLSTFAEGIYTVDADGNTGSSSRLTTGQLDELPDWQPVNIPRRTPFDFDGDGRSDISVFRPSNGAWYIQRSTAGFWGPVWGLSTDVIVPADYDGDLKTDVAVWRASDGNFYVLNSFDSTVRIENFGLSGDIPTGGDFDGDSKADVAVWRGGAQGVLYYRASMGNPNRNITSIPWGVNGDKPVVGDYDGDGRTDAAVFRPSNGVWYIRKSSDGQLIGYHFGLASDVVVPADYDADGRADLTAFRDGTWYVLRSTLGFTAFQFGVAGDIPVPADYDGDGRSDAAVYRNGVWWILKSQTGSAEAVAFGLSGDRPAPAAFVR